MSKNIVNSHPILTDDDKRVMTHDEYDAIVKAEPRSKNGRSFATTVNCDRNIADVYKTIDQILDSAKYNANLSEK